MLPIDHFRHKMRYQENTTAKSSQLTMILTIAKKSAKSSQLRLILTQWSLVMWATEVKWLLKKRLSIIEIDKNQVVLLTLRNMFVICIGVVRAKIKTTRLKIQKKFFYAHRQIRMRTKFFLKRKRLSMLFSREILNSHHLAILTCSNITGEYIRILNYRINQ